MIFFFQQVTPPTSEWAALLDRFGVTTLAWVVFGIALWKGLWPQYLKEKEQQRQEREAERVDRQKERERQQEREDTILKGIAKGMDDLANAIKETRKGGQ